MGGEQIQLPGLRELGPCLSEGAVQLLCLPALHNALAVGRIGDDPAVHPAPVEGAGVRRFKPYNVVHLGQLGVVPGQLHGGRVDIAAPDLIVPVELPVLGLIGGIHPGLSGEPAPLLSGEGAVQARSPVFGDEGGLDGDGA